jgi:hypothetical protein
MEFSENIQHYFDRAIDNPGLNQDSTFDKKDDENFDESDDFHKHDDTSNDEDKEADESSGIFDGNINI